MPRTIRDEDKPGVPIEDVKVLSVSAKAALYDLGERGEMWIPHSQVHDDSELYYDAETGEMNEPEGKLVVTQWIAEKKGLA